MSSSVDLHEKILAFLTCTLAREHHQSCDKIELTYSPAGAFRVDTLKTWTPSANPEIFEGIDGKKSPVYTKQLVAEVLEIAENHADSYGSGRHRFAIRTHQHLGARETHAFVILPSADAEGGELVAGGELQPTQVGLVGQLMRHLENRDRQAHTMMAAYLGGMNQHMQQMRDENEALRLQLAAKDRERLEWLTTIEEARSKEHDRQIEAQQVVGKEERKTHAAKKIMALLPVALSTFTRKGAPTSKKSPPSPLAILVGKLNESLTDDQRAQLGGFLSMEQGIMLTEIVAVVENGDSALLPTMLHDLTSGLSARQVHALMATLRADQQTMFVEAIQLAKVQAEPNPEAASSDQNKKTNGTELAVSVER